MHGLYLLWWVQEKHVPVAIVAALLAAGDIAITALEIPTGWLADRFGHRASLIAGSLAQTVGMLFCWLGEGVPGLLAATVIVGVGDAFRSGADQALLYRSSVALGREADFQRLEARSRALQLVALVAFILVGGVIVERGGFAAGWMVEAAVSAIGLAIALAMIEPPAAASASASAATETGRDDADLGCAETSGRAIALAPLLRLILPASLLGAVASVASFVAQTGGDADPAGMTVLVAVITLAEATGAAIAGRLQSGMRSQLVLSGAGAGVIAAALVSPAAFVPVVVTLSFLQGVALPLRAAAIQRLAADHARARAASIASACDKASATIALLSVGALKQPQRARRSQKR